MNQCTKTAVCRACKEEKRIEELSLNRTKKGGFENLCKSCRSKERYEGKSYFVERLRKHAIRTGRSLNYDIDALYERWKATNNCAYCDVELTRESGATNQDTFDHIYLGCNINDNLVICCRSCNAAKGKDHVYDFYLRSDKFTDELFDVFATEMARWILRKEPSRQYVEQVKAGFKVESDELKADDE